jgi:hypothetical protein
VGAVSALVAVGWGLLCLLTGLLGLALLVLLAVLCLPVDLQARVEAHWVDDGEPVAWAEAVRYEARLSWAWGLLRLALSGQGPAVNPELRLVGVRWSRTSRGERPARTGAGSRRQSRRRSRRAASFRKRRSWAEVKVYLWGLQQLWTRLGLELRGDVAVGLEDPMLTGLLAGAWGAMGWSRSVRLVPDFCATRVEGWVTLHGRIYLIQAVWVGLQVLWSPPIRRRWWPVRRRFKWAISQ